MDEEKDYAEERKSQIENFVKNLPVCDASEYEAEEKRLAEKKIADRKRHLEDNYKKVAPFRYKNESFDTYKASEENEKVYEWLKGFADAVEKGENTKNLIYINGKSGTGKTHLAYSLVRQLGGDITTSLELCITYDSCRDFNSKTTRIQYLKQICSQDVFVIDEIGKGIEAIEKEILPYLINEFYNSGKLLVFTGNENNEVFNQIIGEASADRFAECGVYMSLVGESARRKK